MSKLKALITTLILSTSSAAMAAPTVSFSAHASAQVNVSTGGPMVRDHRDDVRYAPSYRPYQVAAKWHTLSSSLTASTGRNAVRLQHPMAFSWLRLQATAGSSFIESITLRFADGSRQVIDLDKYVDLRAPAQFSIRGNKAITQIVVNGSGRRGASYQLLGYGAEQAPIYQPPMPLPQPVYHATLADHLVFEGTDGRRFITVGAKAGSFRSVRLQSMAGRVFVKQLLVSYTDGSSQIIRTIDTSLRAGQSIDLKLDGAGRKQIERLVIYTDPDQSPGELSIFGM